MFLKISFECRRKTGEPGEKPAEASMDWKPNAHKAPGPGLEPGTSVVQGEGTTAAPPAPPKQTIDTYHLVAVHWLTELFEKIKINK